MTGLLPTKEVPSCTVYKKMACWSERHMVKSKSKSIEWFMEDQASRRRVVWLIPSPPPPPLPSASCLSLKVFLCVAGRAYWPKRGKGVGEEPNQTTERKPNPLRIIHYCLSGVHIHNCCGSFIGTLKSVTPLSGVAVQARQSTWAGTVSILCSLARVIATPLSGLSWIRFV